MELKQLKTFEELKSLPSETKVYEIRKGNIKDFVIIGGLKSTTGICVSTGDKPFFIYPHTFKKDSFYTTESDSAKIGHLMIKQLKQKKEDIDKDIENIMDIYVKSK